MTARRTKLRIVADSAPAPQVDAVVRLIEQTCQTAIEGRRAARAIAHWSKGFQLTEPESQILWCVRDAADGSIDQTTVAKRLALSPAQVSASVEKLRSGGWISPREAPGDRRRRLWQLSLKGNELLIRMLLAGGELSRAGLPADEGVVEADSSRKAIA